jgi:hypothetical protein
MSEETTPKVSAATYEEGIVLLESELERIKTMPALDTRAKDRIEAALEDLKKKAAAAAE